MPPRRHPTSDRSLSNRTIGAILILLIAAFAIATASVRPASAIDDPRELLKFLKKNGAKKDAVPKNAIPKGKAGVPGAKQFGNTGAKPVTGKPGTGPTPPGGNAVTGPRQVTNNPTGAPNQVNPNQINPNGPARAVTGPGDGRNPQGKAALFGKGPAGKGADLNAGNSKLGNAGFGKGPAGKDGNAALGKFGNPKGPLGNPRSTLANAPNARFPGGRPTNFQGVHSRIANSASVFEARRLVGEHRRELTTWRQLMPRRPLPFERGFSGVPPVNETRFVSTEMMFQVGPNVSRQQVDAAAGRLGLTAISTRTSTVTGGTVYHFRVAAGRPVSEIVRSLEAENLGAAAPNYVYQLTQEPEAPAAEADQAAKDLAAKDLAASDLAAKATAAAANGQYIVSKLRLGEVHQVATGSNVLIGVIDSKIDINHPDLVGAIAEQYDAVGRPEQPHSHGTGMVGAIVAHQRLMGIAPAARILAVTAFSTSTRQSPEATTRNILVGLDWAISKGARVINMSFAGPYDPMLQLAMKNAAAKGVVLIAASGNSGPKSPPLFPAADPNVIGVAATDENDKLFAQSVRGPHVALSAPGVDIMVPAPDNSYQITTGTSVAAAHVSGVAALLIERYPSVDAATVLEVLTSSAKRLNPKGRDDQTGWGLIDPASALAELDARMAAGNQVASPVTPPTAPKTTAAKQPTAPKQPTTPRPASVTTTAR